MPGGLYLYGAALMLMALTACRVVEKTAEMPVKAVRTFVPGSKSGHPDPGLVQVAVQRYADDFIARSVAGIDEYARQVNTDEARAKAAKWKLAFSSAAVAVASGPNPTANLLDLVAMATLARMVLEGQQNQHGQSAALQSWIHASRILETNAWKLVDNVFTAPQLEALRQAIQQWHDDNPQARTVFLARPQEFASIILQTAEKSHAATGVLDFVGLDATAGLDPAVREVTRTRLFAERTLFVAQHMPVLMRWQIELLTAELLHQAPVARSLESVERLSRTTETMSQTAAQLPERLSAERKAILEALATQEGKLRGLSSEITQTLKAGGNMSDSLNATLKTFASLMARFGVGQTNAAASASSTNSNPRPFDILDYAKTAEQLTAMCKGLNEVMKELNTSLDSPALEARLLAVNRLSDHATGEVRHLIYQVFVLAAALILFTFGCAWAYRKGREPASR